MRAENKRANSTVEWMRFVASILVIFIHYPLSATFLSIPLGSVVLAVARSAVPFFFLVSGYYSYQANLAKIKKKLLKIISLMIIAIAIYAMYDIVVNGVQSAISILADPTLIYQLLIFNRTPFTGTLWFLPALVVCYVILYLYSKLYEVKGIAMNYNPLYTILPVEFGLLFVILPFITEYNIGYGQLFFRNGYVLGSTFFVIGIWIHQHQDDIFQVVKLDIKTASLIFLFSWYLSFINIRVYGGAEIPIGAAILAVEFLLIAIKYPNIPHGRIFGQTSIVTYVTHTLVGRIIELMLTSKVDVITKIVDSYSMYNGT